MRWAAVLLLVAAAGVLHLTRPTDPGPGSDCEPIGTGAVREPANALSAIAIVAAGAHIARRGDHEPFGRAVAAAGSASLLLHVTAHPIAASLDLAGAVAAIAAALWLVWSRRPDLGSIIPPIGVFVAGVTIWIGSRTGAAWCFPDAAVTGHAVWHLAVAAAALLLARAANRHRTRPAG